MTGRIIQYPMDLRNQLRLRSEQRPAWDRFINTVQQTIAHINPAIQGKASSRTLEQGISAYETALNAHLEAVRTIGGALYDLTRALDDTQTQKLKLETAALYRTCSPSVEGGE